MSIVLNPERKRKQKDRMHIYGALETCIIVAALLKYAAVWRGTATERQTEADGCVVPESAGPDFTQFD